MHKKIFYELDLNKQIVFISLSQRDMVTSRDLYYHNNQFKHYIKLKFPKQKYPSKFGKTPQSNWDENGFD